MNFKITKTLREELKKPFGKLIKDDKAIWKELTRLKYKKLISVGDFSSWKARELGFLPDISIVDGKSERKKIDESLRKKIQAPIEITSTNPAGVITNEAWEAVKLSFCYNCPVKVSIKGEEDLLFLAAAFFAPLESVILYGIRQKGQILALVDRKLKKRTKKYLNWHPEEDAIVGGTFDRLHVGHRFLLLTAIEKGKKVLIGCTTNHYLRNWKPTEKGIKTPRTRIQNLKKFLEEFDFHYGLYKIDEPVGPAKKIGNLIIVSDDTFEQAQKINLLRKEKKIKLLKIIKIKQILAQDGKVVASRRIRKGEIDENGFTSRRSRQI